MLDHKINAILSQVGMQGCEHEFAIRAPSHDFLTQFLKYRVYCTIGGHWNNGQYSRGRNICTARQLQELIRRGDLIPHEDEPAILFVVKGGK